jgi:SAM-dependent methyltransferase
MKNDVINLYNDLPEIYDHISNDRDFDAQVKEILSYKSSRPLQALELCAGPARHAAALERNGISTYAIDICSGMKNFAIQYIGVESEKYIVSDLTKEVTEWGLPSHCKFDVITLLRYSVGYFNKTQLNNLVKAVSSILSDDGIFIIELHNLAMARDGFNKLGIKSRESIFNGKKVSCLWPHKDPEWSNTGWLLSMDVKITIEDALESEEVIFNSVEYIHCFDDIEFMCNLHSLKHRIINEPVDSTFSHSIIVEISLGS